MKAKQYMYFGPIGLFGPEIKTFDSFKDIPLRIKKHMNSIDGDWKLLKAVDNKIFVCDRAGRIRSK
jgi:hypothetical protein